MIKTHKQILLVLLMIGAFSVTGLGKTLDEFLSDIKSTANELRQLEEKIEDADSPRSEVDKTFSTINTRFEGKYEVFTESDEIEVKLQFLSRTETALKSSTKTKDVKLIALKGAIDRLDSLASEVELLKEAEARDTSKATEKQALEKILNDEKYRPITPENESLAARFMRWLDQLIRRIFQNSAPRQAPKAPGMPWLVSGLQIVVILVAIGLVVFVLVRFGPSLLKKIRRERKFKSKQLILGEEIPEGVSSNDLLKEAEELARSGNIRGAIRKGYISLLFELGERRELKIAKHKTNRDYLADLKRNEELLPGMRLMTRDFELHWYGEKQSDNEDWSRFRSTYKETLGSAG